jgi:hypothetical protein
MVTTSTICPALHRGQSGRSFRFVRCSPGMARGPLNGALVHVLPIDQRRIATSVRGYVRTSGLPRLHHSRRNAGGCRRGALVPIFEGTMKNFRPIENQKGIATICLLHIQHADLGRVILFETDGTFPLQGSFPVIP